MSKSKEPWCASDVNAILKGMNDAMDDAEKKSLAQLERIKAVRQTKINDFTEIASAFNHARDQVFKSLTDKDKRNGDFESMEVKAVVDDTPGQRICLKLTGVWGAVGLRVYLEADGYHVDDLNDYKAVLTRDQLLALLGKDLSHYHPEERRRAFEHAKKLECYGKETA